MPVDDQKLSKETGRRVATCLTVSFPYHKFHLESLRTMVFVKYLANMKTLCFCWLLLGKSIDSINSALKTAIHPHSCARWKALYEKPQEVMWNPPNYDPCVHPPSLTNEEVYFVLEVLKVDPTLYLDELQKKLEEATRQKSGVSTINMEFLSSVLATHARQ